MSSFDLSAQRERLALAPDCSRCFGLCCVAHGFKASASFAIDKPPGEPCPNLLTDFSCTIHRTLRQQGFSGCTAYTCYGAGQKIAQDGFRGTDWRDVFSSPRGGVRGFAAGCNQAQSAGLTRAPARKSRAEAVRGSSSFADK